MLEPPDLADDRILGVLADDFGIPAAALTFLPVGNDAASWAYRVEPAQGPARFLKVRAGTGPPPGAAVPAYLHRHGVPRVLAPLPTRGGGGAAVVDRFSLTLYPMLNARPAPRPGCPRASGASWARPSA